MSNLSQRPFFVLLMGIGALAMVVPAIHALSIENHAVARSFFYSALLFLLLTLFIGLATANYKSTLARGYLVSLLAAFLVLPLMLAVPMYEAVPRMSFLEAWFESVSSITTTGATLYDSPRELPRSVHLWRALMGWLGGLLIWVSAISILAPLNIGGFEVRATRGGSASEKTFEQIGRVTDPSERLVRYGSKLIPLYVALTGLLWLSLTVSGEVTFVALCHAMSVMATSGISPVGGLIYSPAGFLGEFIIVLFFVFALSRVAFSRGVSGQEVSPLYKDNEFRLALTLIGVLVAVLFLRHGVVAFEDGTNNDLGNAARALWGAFFTITSFLTTTGFESADWTATRNWSGLGTPGLMLVGLSLIGGGVATTAGGIKLLRVYALWKHGQREVERLVHPSSVGGAGAVARQIRRQGAQIAWIFFMLFTISIAAVMVLLALTGVQFETAMVLSVAALSTTGPLAAIAAESPISYAGIPDSAKIILAFAMVLGRLEALAIIALLNPEFWRR
ncbi:Trk potassium transport system integral membrane component TrkH [Octadecabacter arcticus 238]|jgi:trk system potassium uptake protein TrkH|uniref:Trk potassium transport system integral membrane component TrkH n=1 Tax=Octadecabacter arcticus 238 TaxID=391616 RepID=M9RJT2_9RHOB|nr:potassium transporter TrkG [Octadecabacter arcticus]AGI72028.1 Trk potassium transport system integral membrane component TrkH [Octadecabacter arcticus 238]